MSFNLLTPLVFYVCNLITFFVLASPCSTGESISTQFVSGSQKVPERGTNQVSRFATTFDYQSGALVDSTPVPTTEPCCFCRVGHLYSSSATVTGVILTAVVSRLISLNMAGHAAL